MFVKLNTTNHRTSVFLQRSTASMSIDKMEVKSTTPSYGIAFEMEYNTEWDAYLTQLNNGIRWEVVDGEYEHKKIIIYTEHQEIIWIGKGFADWKASK
jgi:hypothetical protein